MQFGDGGGVEQGSGAEPGLGRVEEAAGELRDDAFGVVGVDGGVVMLDRAAALGASDEPQEAERLEAADVVADGAERDLEGRRELGGGGAVVDLQVQEAWIAATALDREAGGQSGSGTSHPGEPGRQPLTIPRSRFASRARHSNAALTSPRRSPGIIRPRDRGRPRSDRVGEQERTSMLRSLVDRYGARGIVAAKVPEITALFWAIKVLTTGLGESTSDFLAHKSAPLAGLLGLAGLAVGLHLQLRAREYRAPTYWFAVLMVAVFGTVAADALHVAGLPYAVTTPLYGAIVATVFAAWQRREGTLSIHSIVTPRRERFYWAAVLATFALGTAAGDLTAISLKLGYSGSIVVFAAAIAVPWLAWRAGRLNPVIAFWAAYVVTRPLGASVADWLGKPAAHDGLGLGDGLVSALGFAVFVALVAYLALVRNDVQQPQLASSRPQPAER